MISQNKYIASHKFRGRHACPDCGLTRVVVERYGLLCGQPAPEWSPGAGPKPRNLCPEGTFCLTAYGQSLVASGEKKARVIALRFARDMGCDPDDAVDEAYRQLVALVPTFDPLRSRFPGRVGACIYRRLIGWHKLSSSGSRGFNRKMGRLPVDMSGIDSTRDARRQGPEQFEHDEHVAHLISPADSDAPFVRDYYVDGLADREIGAKYGVSRKRAKYRVNRGIEKIRKHHQEMEMVS